MQRPKLKLTSGTHVLELAYDKCRKGEHGEYGPWQCYCVKLNGVEHSWFAPHSLWDKLDAKKKGDKFNVVVISKEDGKNAYDIQENNQEQNGPAPQNNNKVWEEKDLRIGRLSAIKSAVELVIAHKSDDLVKDAAECRKIADSFMTYVYKGLDTPEAQKQSPEINPDNDDSDLPF